MQQFEDLFSFIMFHNEKKTSKNKKSNDLFEKEVQELKNFLDGFKPLKK